MYDHPNAKRSFLKLNILVKFEWGRPQLGCQIQVGLDISETVEDRDTGTNKR